MESWVDLTIDLTSDTGEDATTSDTGDAFTSDMYNRRLLAFYVPILYQSGIFFWLLLQLAICLLV